MGLTLSQFATRAAALFANIKDARILLVGLDNAGKTTLLYKFKHGEAVQTIPTIGFNTEEVQYKNIRFNMWDVGGQERIRALWQHYYVGAEACIYMVDSTDHDRFEEARDQLHAMLTDDRLRRISLLLLANKQVSHHSLPAASSSSLFLSALLAAAPVLVQGLGFRVERGMQENSPPGTETNVTLALLSLIEDTHNKTNLHSCLRTGPAAGCVGIQDRRGNASDTFTLHDQVAR